jgi:hypothetical protein
MTVRKLDPTRGGRTLLAATALGLVVLAIAASVGRTSAPSAPFRPQAARAIPHADVAPKPSRARAATTWAGGPTTASTGEVVTVYVSPSLAPELGTAQTWADFIAGLVHGPELPKLTAYIAPLDEIAEMCGDNALGCYGSNEMASVGETEYGITAAEVVRHEYGHHIAWNRVNAPWSAVDWGPKNWASIANVCRRAADGTAYPGDEENHYVLNPGEAWAETYRLLDEQQSGATGSGWQLIDPSFRPDEPTLQAAERDVLQPWATSTRTTFKHRFTTKGTRLWSIPIATPLDGDLAISISLPKGGIQDVTLVDATRKTTLATGLWSSTKTKHITTQVCGARSLVLKVEQGGAYGRIVVTVEKP